MEKKTGIEKENELLQVIHNAEIEAKSSLSILFDKIDTDFEQYSGRQWSDEDSEKAERMGISTLVINMIAKQVNALCGQQRQNKNEVTVRAKENGDVITASVLNNVVSWAQNRRNYDFVLSDGAKDAVIGGIGIIKIYPDYSVDVANGDIVFDHIPVTEVRFDPHSRRRDCSDMRYIYHDKSVNKDLLIMMYPEKAEEIRSATGATPTDNSGNSYISGDRGETVVVKEFWDKIIEKRKVLIFKDGTVSDFDNFTPAEIDGLEEEYEVESRSVERVRMTVSVGNVILSTKVDPYRNNMFPYVFIWGYYTPSIHSWEYRVQGVVRQLIDPQKEKNVRRTQMVEVARRQISGGYIYEEGALDPNEWASAPKFFPLLKKKPGREITPIVNTLDFTPLISLEKNAEADFNLVGMGGDFLGQTDEKGISGVVQRQRQKQSLVSVEEIRDNLSLANMAAGKLIISLVAGNFSIEKIKRILGQDKPFKTEDLEKQLQLLTQQATPSPVMLAQMAGLQQAYNETNDDMIASQIVSMQNQMQSQIAQYQQQAGQIEQQINEQKALENRFWATFSLMDAIFDYDIVLDEIRNNSSNRAAALESITEAAHYGIQIPPEVIVSLLDVPADIREMMLSSIEQQKAAAAQVSQMEMDIRRADAMAKTASAQYKMAKLDTENIKMSNEAAKKVDGSVAQ